MLPYFPFDRDTYKMTMGTQALDNNCLIEIDTTAYAPEVTLKRTLLAEDHAHYFQAHPISEALQWEAIEILLPNMAQNYPTHFSLTIKDKRWHWHNHILGEQVEFLLGENATLPLAPLNWLGQQVQEDLLLLSGTPEKGMLLIAGQLCFPSSWGLEEKMGKPFLGIHEDIPLFMEHIGRSSNLLLERLKVGRPVWRVNWGIKSTPRLNLTPRFFAEVAIANTQITPENAGDRCYLRLERQVLTRLPHTNGILFTIHTYQEPIQTTATNVEYIQRLTNILKSTPSSVLDYKGISPFADALLAYLNGVIQKKNKK